LAVHEICVILLQYDAKVLHWLSIMYYYGNVTG